LHIILNIHINVFIQEALVDSKCKQYSAGLQDQINQLKAKVDRIENDPPSKGRNKRQVNNAIPNKKSSPPACSTSSSFCTYYYPDHPDSIPKKGSLGPMVSNKELLKNDIQSYQVKGMPTSCNDLQKLGHPSNGFYSIKKVKPDNQGTKLETVFCDFKSPKDSNGIFNLYKIYKINFIYYKIQI